jgi:hypothetical protein
VSGGQRKGILMRPAEACDVIVIGGGSAALEAAISARDPSLRPYGVKFPAMVLTSEQFDQSMPNWNKSLTDLFQRDDSSIAR